MTRPERLTCPSSMPFIAEVFARSNALRREIFGNLGRAATAKDVATRMREHLADLRKQYSAKTPRRNHAHR